MVATAVAPKSSRREGGRRQPAATVSLTVVDLLCGGRARAPLPPSPMMSPMPRMGRRRRWQRQRRPMGLKTTVATAVAPKPSRREGGQWRRNGGGF
uniref:Uncharacterized protein n=1 Tax=Oryza glumipatula TaxID=40148 RepID=A0A0E0BRX4_9ORYZ